MNRMLVVVDGSVQSSLALERAIEIASALPHSELLLLSISDPPLPWQINRPAGHARHHNVARVIALGLARTKAAGVSARSRIESGEKAAVAAKIAREEKCDHIFMPEQGPTPVARAIASLTGLTANTAASRILTLSRVPVTVIAYDDYADADVLHR